MKLTPKLTLLFVLFAAALLTVLDLLAYNIGRTMLEAAAISELESTAGEKQAALTVWLEAKQADIKALAVDPITLEEAAKLKRVSSSSSVAGAIRTRLIQEFHPRVSAGEFLSVMLLDPRTGKIIVSTDPNEHDKPRDASSFFLKGKQGAYLTPIYFSQELGTPAVTASAPVIAKGGELLGVLVGRVDLDELNTIIQRRSGLRQTDEAFLVNTAHQPITQPRFLPDTAVLQRGIYTVPVNTCLQGKTGTVFADDYQGIPVIAAYRWLPERQMCLIVKISQAEALVREHSWAVTNTWTGLAVLLIASLIAVGLSHTLIAPIRAMQMAAQRYREGDLTVRLPEVRRDELGLLAREFNVMATALAEKENQLRSYSHELENRVAERTKDLQKSQDLLSKSQSISHLGSWELDLIDQRLVWSDEVYRIFGLQVQEFEPTYEAFLEIVHPDDRSFVDETFSASLRDGKDTYEVEHRIVRRDNGEIRFVYIKCENTRDTSGSIFRAAGMIQDITERKQVQMKLADALEFTERILTSSPVGVLTYKLTGECLSANTYAAQMIGATVQEITSQNFHELGSWKRSGLFELAKRAISTRTYTAADIHHLSTYGREMWLRAQFVIFQAYGEDLLLLTIGDITDRVQAEVALRRFELLSANSRDIILFLRREDGRVLDANAAALQTYGYNRDEILRMTIHDLRTSKEATAISDQMAQADAGGILFETVHRRKDGSTFPVEVSSQGATIGGQRMLVSIVRDITERKKAEEALQDSETRYRTLMEKSLEAIYIYEAETKRIVVANPAFLNLLGYTADEVHDLMLYDIVGHDRESIDKFLDQLLSEGGISIGERLWRRKDGTPCPVEVTANKIQQGEKILVFVVARDISERKQAEEALREKERLLSDAQHIGQIGSFIYHIQNPTVKFSDEMYQLLDISPENFRNERQDFLALIYPSDRQLAVKWIDDLKAGIQSKELEFRIFRQNGELRYLHCRGAVEFNSDGAPTRFVGTMQDVTERKLAEIQINQQIKQLTSLSEIDRAIISGTGQRQTLDVILSQAISQLQVDAAGILLLDSDGQTLHYAAAQGFHSQLQEEIQVRLGESQAGRVAKERRLIRIPDLREQTHDPLFKILVEEENFVSYVGVPLIVKREVRGVLEVFHRTFFQPYQAWIDFLNALAGQTAIALENAALLGNLQTSNRELAQAYDATLEGWSRAMDLRDRETEGHTRRVTELTLKVAGAMGMSEEQLIHIRRGALLHDIGKLGIPDHILFKQDKLTPEEWEIMQKHPEYAYEMLSSIQYLKPALVIPYFHHEKWDGSGYPLGLQGRQIPLEARIFSVVDVWDALLSDRPYRKAWTVERTLEHIQALAGSHFDPNVVDCFLKVMKT